MKQIGTIKKLFISTKISPSRLEQETIALDEGGVLKDKFHHTDIQRSVLLTSLASYTLANDHHVDMPHGSLGENLLMDFNPYKLTPGTKLHIGSATLEISQNCTICNHLSKIDTI